MTNEVQVVSASRDVFVATVGDVLVVHFRLETPASTVASWEAALATITKAGHKGIWLGIIDPESAAPDDAAKTAFTRFFEDNKDRLAGFVIGVLYDGFRAATTRAVIGLVMNVSPRFRFPFPKHVAKSVADAADLAGGLSAVVDRATLARAIADIQKR
jgi:hypothetical protein